LVFSSLVLSTSFALADKPMTLEARLANAVMKSGEKQHNYLRIALNGCEAEPNKDRNPVNVAFVVDRSGSMSGHRIAQAKEAAIMAVKRLNANDIASVVVFDNRVNVLIPARKVTDQRHFIDTIRNVGVGGTTAIYDGVTTGASEVRTNKDPRRLNRIVLLSDGLANVGPTRASEFAKLGRDLLGESISVTTIGLGLDYNEDLMKELARASDGNHAFASVPNDLIQIFNREFDDVLAACAQTVSIDVETRAGVRVVRAISREGSIEGERAQFKLNQVYQATEHYVLLELETDANASTGAQDLGRVQVAYTVPATGERRTIDTAIQASFSQSADEVAASTNKIVMESVIEQTTRERAQAAIKLRDEGRMAEAQALFQQNVSEIQMFLAAPGVSSQSLEALKNQYDGFATTSTNAPAALFNTQRKMLYQMDGGNAKAGSRY
jgi:Ca-activated chloride channel family protein